MVTNRYAKRNKVITELITLGHKIDLIKPINRVNNKENKIFIIHKDTQTKYQLIFQTDWMLLKDVDSNLSIGINAVDGYKIRSSVDNNLLNLFNQVIKILYSTTNIKTPTIIL